MEVLFQKIETFFKDSPEIARFFRNRFMYTLDKTIRHTSDGGIFVITGDIPAMWLRDSSCQLEPYFSIACENEDIAEIIVKLVKRQVQYILIDPYANAFNESANARRWTNDKTKMSAWVWERKYEIDSLCYPIRTAYKLWKTTGRTEHFSADFHKALQTICKVWEIEQNHEHLSEYTFEREHCYFTDTLSRGGKGALTKPDIGLLWSGFRPSDDACMYGYLIPANMFACVVLGYMAEIAEAVFHDSELAGKASVLQKQIRLSLEKNAVVHHEKFGTVYAYEIDGFGQYNIMDDANVPSLLSIPFLGYVSAENEVYQNTRRLILSDANPYFYKGQAASGIGSPHTPVNHIWPIALVMQGLTCSEKAEKKRILELLLRTDGGTGCMHESFNVDNPHIYTREWFSWADAFFCTLVLDSCGLYSAD